RTSDVTALAGAVAVVNAGSSSLKVGLYDLGAHGVLRAVANEQPDDIEALGAWLRAQQSARRIAAVGHRVVHGGTQYAAPARIDPGVLEALERLVPLAPLHQP